MSHGAHNEMQVRRAAQYLDRIVKSARPSELPVEYPMAFDLMVNAGAASAIGLRIPDTILSRANDVLR